METVGKGGGKKEERGEKRSRREGYNDERKGTRKQENKKAKKGKNERMERRRGRRDEKITKRGGKWDMEGKNIMVKGMIEKPERKGEHKKK